MSFKKNGYQIVKKVLSQETVKILSLQFDILKDVQYHYMMKKENDYLGCEQVTKSFAYYAPYTFEALLPYLQQTMEKITGKTLLPSNSYARIYYNGAVLDKHKDRPHCEYSATICIEDNDNPWDIWFEDRNGKEIPITLRPGDMAVYAGVELAHWRNEYQGRKHTQTFLHYVDANGPYTDYKFSGRKMLGINSRLMYKND